MNLAIPDDPAVRALLNRPLLVDIANHASTTLLWHAARSSRLNEEVRKQSGHLIPSRPEELISYHVLTSGFARSQGGKDVPNHLGGEAIDQEPTVQIGTGKVALASTRRFCAENVEA